MSNYNELEYAAILALVSATPPVTLPELEHLFLDLWSVAPGKLNERWYTLFAEPELSWDGAAHAWLTTQGVSAGGTLNERWIEYWADGGTIPVQPFEPYEVDMVAGQSGQQVGYRATAFGSIVPDVLPTGETIRRLTVRKTNGNVNMVIEGLHPADKFERLIIGSLGVLWTADATHTQLATRTRWRWTATGWDLTDGDSYTVIIYVTPYT